MICGPLKKLNICDFLVIFDVEIGNSETVLVENREKKSFLSVGRGGYFRRNTPLLTERNEFF